MINRRPHTIGYNVNVAYDYYKGLFTFQESPVDYTDTATFIVKVLIIHSSACVCVHA